MKPKKRVMCPECWREKMLFETQEKALNFIRFNGDDIDTKGKKLRPYYCEACGGYHITSKTYSKKFEGRTEKLISAYERDKKVVLDELEKSQNRQKKLNKLVDRIYGRYMSDKMFRNIAEYMDEHYPNIKGDDRKVIIKRLDKRQNLESTEYWGRLTDEEKHNIISKIAVRSFELKVVKKKEVVAIMKREYKRVPIGCATQVFEELITLKRINNYDRQSDDI